MNAKTALKAILALSIAGMLFSGYLSYSELFAGACAVGGCSNVGSVPACVYGFVMYLVVFVLSLLGLMEKKESAPVGI
ncbi:hypothetical protein H0O03_03225 [Candidatus Micrarchaeota archaeon]|nr:hypothetical protein [Candidatus Micrarchaeota archaeon]